MHKHENSNRLTVRRQTMQLRAMSLIEAASNVAAGYLLAVATQIVAFPLFGLRLPLATNLLIGAIFTVVSMARSYLLRRLFEGIRVRRRQRKAAAPVRGAAAMDASASSQPAMR
jgi:hypothetical protein